MQTHALIHTLGNGMGSVNDSSGAASRSLRYITAITTYMLIYTYEQYLLYIRKLRIIHIALYGPLMNIHAWLYVLSALTWLYVRKSTGLNPTSTMK